MRGDFTISLDFELLWGLAGWTEKQIEDYSPRVKNSVEALKKILEVLSNHDIKVTIGYVGAMKFSNSDDLISFAGDFRPNYQNPIFSSYNSILPLIDKYDKKLFFCSDFLNELAKDSQIELASHTFSHFYCLENGVMKRDFEKDLKLMNKLDNDLKTIIFPRNQISVEMLELCSKYGFTHFRGKLNHFLYDSAKTSNRYSIKGALRLIDTYIPYSGNQNFKGINAYGGLLSVPESSFLRPYSPILSFFDKFKVEKIKKMMSNAAKYGCSYHLWWHPHNFGLNMKENLFVLSSICEHYTFLNKKYGMESKFISEY